MNTDDLLLTIAHQANQLRIADTTMAQQMQAINQLSAELQAARTPKDKDPRVQAQTNPGIDLGHPGGASGIGVAATASGSDGCGHQPGEADLDPKAGERAEAGEGADRGAGICTG